MPSAAYPLETSKTAGLVDSLSASCDLAELPRLRSCTGSKQCNDESVLMLHETGGGPRQGEGAAGYRILKQSLLAIVLAFGAQNAD